MGRRGTPNIIGLHLEILPTTITTSDIPSKYTHCHDYVCYSSKPKINAMFVCIQRRPWWLSVFASISHVPFAFCCTGSAASALHDVLRPDGRTPLFVGPN